MSYRTNLVYRYDGSFSGFLCCVFQCFQNRELPSAIEPWDAPQETLFPIREIETIPEQAQRVDRSIPRKMSAEAYSLVRDAFLTCLEEKELKMLRFLLLGYRVGPQVMQLLTDERVHVLDRAVFHARHEAHMLTGFLRFSDYGGFLAAEIGPKNNVMPLLAPHFCERFSCEDFLIWDSVHHTGLLHQKSGEYRFFEADRVELPQPDENEQQYRELWKRFYQTIAVEGRENPRQRRTMMAKRYWPWITEMQEDPFVLRQKNRERAGGQDILKGTVGAGTQSLPNVVE